jgi:hypothetical protein
LPVLRDARFKVEMVLFHMSWCHRGPFPRRTRERRKADKRLSRVALKSWVELIGAQMKSGTYTDDCNWRPTA